MPSHRKRAEGPMLVVLRCGCNAAFYLVSMRSAPDSADCGGDFYVRRRPVAVALAAPPTAPPSRPLAAAGAPSPSMVSASAPPPHPQCDANSVCGVNCDEIDIVEANTRAFQSAPHTAYDGAGQGRRADGRQYGEGGSVVDTARPFRVHAYFGEGPKPGQLASMKVRLVGHTGKQMSFYAGDGSYLRALSGSARAGMTVAIS